MDTYNGQRVVFRLPYTMGGEALVGSDQEAVHLPETALMHRIDKPFEVRRVVVRLTALDDEQRPLDPQPTVLDRLIKVYLADYTKNETVSRDLPLRRLPGGELFWEPESPFVIERTGGHEVALHGRKFELANGVAFDWLRVQVTFEGENLVLAPPMETT